MFTRIIKLTISSAILLVAGTAAAQDAGAYGGNTYGTPVAAPAPAPQPVVQAPPAVPTPTPLVEEEPLPVNQAAVQEKAPASIFERWGTALAIGGGVDSFVDRGDTGTQAGGGWNVRAILGTKTMFGFEAAYIGSAQSIDAIGLDQDAVLVGNGAQGSLRLNMTPQYDIGLLLHGGLAWRRYDLTNADFNTSDIAGKDDVLEIPIAAGVQYDYRGMLLDARAEYRFANYGDIMGPGGASSGNAMDRWGIQANVGYRF